MTTAVSGPGITISSTESARKGSKVDVHHETLACCATSPVTEGLALSESRAPAARERGALPDRSACVSEQGALDWRRVDDRETPVVELDPLGEELCAEPVPVARDRVDAASSCSCWSPSVGVAGSPGPAGHSRHGVHGVRPRSRRRAGCFRGTWQRRPGAGRHRVRSRVPPSASAWRHLRRGSRAPAARSRRR